MSHKGNCLKLPRNVTFHDYVALVGDDDADEGHQCKKIRRCMNEILTQEGACGPILRSTDILVDQEVYQWHFLHPCAFVHALCHRQPALGDLLRKQQRLRLGFYMDGIKPGNVLRPDPGRSVSCFYFTFLDLPGWYHAKADGWFYFSCFPEKYISKVSGQHSFLFARMLEIFFEDMDPLNFQSGFPCVSSSGTFLCKAEVGAVLSDEKSLKELWSIRGAAGTKPCCLCQNVVGHMDPEEVAGHAWLKHYSSCDKNQFVKHTPQSFQDMRDRLALFVGSKAEMNRMGQVFGLQYDARGILWHPTVGTRVCPVKHTFYDWMHILVTSGGIAQYEINEFCKAVTGVGLTLGALDAFANGLRFPKCHKKLPDTFFQDRVNQDDAGHLKCFGSEVLQALPVLVLFAQMVLQPAGKLPEQCRALTLLAKILGLLKLQGQAVAKVDTLRRLIDEHAVLFAKLYPRCCKPKFHWLFHVPDNLTNFQVNMSCFSPERKHRAVKTVASHVFNEHLVHNVTLRLGHESLQTFGDNDHVCRGTFLYKPTREIAGGAQMLSFWRDDVAKLYTSRKLMTPSGLIHLADVVYASCLQAIISPKVFLQALLLSGKEIFMAQVDVHSHRNGCQFEASATEALVFWEADFRPVPYVARSCGSFHIYLDGTF